MPTSWTPRLQRQTYALVREANARAVRVSADLRLLDSAVKDKALVAMADALMGRYDEIQRANRADFEAALDRDASDEALLRLKLDRRTVEDLAHALRTLAVLPDPVGAVLSGSRRSGGLERCQIRVPIGVLAVLFDGQPSVIPHVVGMLLKSGNAALLHDASEMAGATNEVVMGILREALAASGAPADAAQQVPVVPGSHRENIRYVITSNEEIDLVIPLLPGGIPKNMLPEATVPIAESAPGSCHIYIDAAADLELATEVVVASTAADSVFAQTVGTLLVHVDVAARLLPGLCALLRTKGVSVRGDERVVTLVPECAEAGEADWRTSRRAPELACAVVDSLTDALEHIDRYSTGHTEAAVTEDAAVAKRFTGHINATTVTINVPTTSNDASANPLDPELGFSTRRLSPRGPLGLTQLTTTKWLVWPSDRDFGRGRPT